MRCLIIINDPPYGTERLYNGLRLAHALSNQEHDVVVFLMSDAVVAAKKGQQTPAGYYNSEYMLDKAVRHGTGLLCSTCLKARALNESELVKGVQPSSMAALAEETIKADRIITF